MNLRAIFKGFVGSNGAKARQCETSAPRGSNMATLSKFVVRPQSEVGTVHWFRECVERGTRGDFTEKTLMTPGLASVILANNPDNRNISEKKVGKYATDILAGNWVYNGESVKIAVGGELNDGQHRLRAIIEANRSIPMKVDFGLPRDSRTTLDQGMGRTAAHYLAMDGVERAKVSASIANILISMEIGGRTKADATHAEIVHRVKSDAAIADAAAYSDKVRKYTRGWLTPAQIGAAYYLFADINPVDAKAYLDQVCMGEGITRKDAAYRARQYLMSVKGELRDLRLEIVMRGWNRFRQGGDVTQIKTFGSFPALV